MNGELVRRGGGHFPAPVVHVRRTWRGQRLWVIVNRDLSPRAGRRYFSGLFVVVFPFGFVLPWRASA